MTRRQAALYRMGLMLMICVSALWAKDRFILGSQLYKNYSSGSAAPVLTTYTYNDSGHRVDMSAFNGADTTAARMSRTVYTYNADNTLAQEVLKSAAGDTMSVVRHGYDANKREIAVATLTKLLVLRYVDSSLYNSTGQLASKLRYSGGSLSFYHDYSYDINGRMTADSLYEKPNGAFLPTQAVIFSYSAEGKVASEKNFQFQTSAWYLISTNKMIYNASGTLASVTQYEGDGSTNRMQDSAAYAYDANSNRTKESDYDQDRTLLSTTEYFWIDTQPVVSIVQSFRQGRSPVATYAGGMIVLTDLRGAAQVSVYSATGRMVQRSQLQGNGHSMVALRGLGRGAYVAVVQSGNNSSSIPLTLIN